jgi:ABC-2 type transport system permease protein
MVLLQFIFNLLIDTSGLIPAMGVVALMLVALYGIGMMVASLALIFKAGWIIAEALHSVISVVTPIAYPLAVLPIFLRKASYFFPTTYGVLTIRHFLIGEDMGFSVGTSLFRLSLLCVAWAAFGLFIFSVVDRKTRREGTLGHY